MSFDLEALARQYVPSRFPEARPHEQEKLIQDWIHKVERCIQIVAGLSHSLGPIRGKRILDIGSGNGGLSIALDRAGAETVGIEVEQELTEIAKTHAAAYQAHPTILLYDGTHFPFEDETFDYGISVSVLEHVDNPIQILREMHRVLKPGGRFFLAFPNRLWPKETHSGLYGITYFPYAVTEWLVKILKYSPLKHNNLHFYTYWDLKRFLRILAQENHTFRLIAEEGQTTHGPKSWIKSLLRTLGIPHQAFLPHLIFVLEKPASSNS